MKTKIYNAILGILEGRIKEAQKAVDAAIESKLNETKSSVGDKYETGRAMMQKEQEMNEGKILKAELLIQQLKHVYKAETSSQISAGSLVSTEVAYFFVGVGIGKLSIDESVVYAISVASPVGQNLLGLSEGENFDFNGFSLKILKIS